MTHIDGKRLCNAFLVLLVWTISPLCYSATLDLNLKDPSGSALSSAPVEIFDAASKKGVSAKPILQSTTDNDGNIRMELSSGNYLIAVKKAEIVGSLGDKFSGTFYPLLTLVQIGTSNKRLELQTLKLTLKDARIVQTEGFMQYYGDAEKGKKARLDGAEGHAGRVIKLVGAPVASLELKFPSNAVGLRGMGTYTPTAFEFRDPKNTLLVRTYMYDGKVKTAHNIMMLGTDLVPDGQNRLVIENIQEKSGVEVPFEPKANVLNDGIVTSFMSNITFLSDETSKPAKLVFRYFYLDDEENPFDLSALVSPGVLR